MLTVTNSKCSSVSLYDCTFRGTVCFRYDNVDLFVGIIVLWEVLLYWWWFVCEAEL